MTFARSVIVIMLVVAFALAAFMIELRRGRNAALEAMDARLIAVLADDSARAAAGIPADLAREALSAGDIQWVGREWRLWLAAPNGGAVQLTARAARGLGPMPLFNGPDGYEVGAPRFDPSWTSPFK